MRIIAGEHRGRRLLPPASDATRPITDRVKQSLFDIVAPLLPESVVYDCFAGTGSMGLECLSRGAGRAIFFERERTALQRLRRNIEMLGVAAQSRVVDGDLFRWFAAPGHAPGEAGRAKIVFLDPPYRFLRLEAQQLKELAARLAAEHLAERGVVVFRHDAHDRLELAPLVAYDQRRYGDMMLQFLRTAAP